MATRKPTDQRRAAKQATSRTAVLESLRGVLAPAKLSLADYRRYLTAKHQ